MALRMCNRLAPLLSFIRNAAFVWQSGEVAPLGALRVRATHGAFALSGEDKACARRRVADVLTKTALGSFLRFRVPRGAAASRIMRRPKKISFGIALPDH